MKRFVFGIIAVLCVFAIVSCSSSEKEVEVLKTLYTVSFDANGGTGTVSPVSQTAVGGAVTLPSGAPLTAPGVGKDFDGWSETVGGGKIVGQYTPTENKVLYAVWVDRVPIVEEIVGANGWVPIFKFELSAGKIYGNYQKMVVDFNLEDLTIKGRSRIFGNYVQKELATARIGTFTPEAGTDDETTFADYTTTFAVLGSWPSGTSNRWIMNNQFGGGTELNNLFADFHPEDETFFTVEYNLRNTFGDWDGGANNPEYSLAGRKPDGTGPFYLGVGIFPEAGGSGVRIYQIKKVKLINEAGDEVLGTPVYYKSEDKLYRAFAGQSDGQDNTNGGKPGWKIISGEDQIVPIDFVAPANVQVTFDLNYPTATDTGTAPTVEPIIPGNRITLPTAPLPTTPPTTAENVWGFDGWYTTPATGGVKVSANVLYLEDTVLYARWIEIVPAKITFNLGGATGTAPAVVNVEKNTGTLTATQLGKPTGITGPGTKTAFGGWYKVDTTAGDFNYKTYSNVVTTSTTFTGDTTIYAYWYTPVADSTLTFGGLKVEALGGGRIDVDGYMIFAASAQNAWLNGNANDTLLSVKFVPDTTIPAGTNLKITYKLQDMIVPTVAAGQTLDAALAWKNGYSSYSGTSSGNYVSWDRTSQGTEKTITKALSTFSVPGSGNNAGFSIQINGGNDGTTIRAGYVYGIKIINIEFE